MSFLTAPSPPLNPLPSAFHLTTKETKELGVAAPVPSLSPHCPDPPAASFKAFLAGCQNVLFASYFLAALPQPLFCLFCHLTPTSQGGGPRACFFPLPSSLADLKDGSSVGDPHTETANLDTSLEPRSSSRPL